MRKTVLISMIFFMVLPVFAPVLSHAAIETIHSHHDHQHNDHSHASESEEFDATTYFSDYLHVELRTAQDQSYQAPDFVPQANSYWILPKLWSDRDTARAVYRPPPPQRITKPDKVSALLLTQRFRI